ncbi:hypothetical protein QQ054_04900 [Oscillatoria amoena NRMC-F 0135]|nr:hypothetical protein [Oscillatoria amoena NRMC-F 0135]
MITKPLLAPFRKGDILAMDVYMGGLTLSTPAWVISCSKISRLNEFEIEFHAYDPDFAYYFRCLNLIVNSATQTHYFCSVIKADGTPIYEIFLVVAKIKDQWMHARYPFYPKNISWSHGKDHKEIFSEEPKGHLWTTPPEKNPEEPWYGTEILNACAFRFDGHAWAGIEGTPLSVYMDGVFYDRANMGCHEKMCYFYSLMAYLSLPSFGQIIHTSKHYIHALELFDDLCEEDVPDEFVNKPYHLHWRKNFVPHLPRIKELMNKQLGLIHSINRTTPEYKAFISHSGNLIIGDGRGKVDDAYEFDPFNTKLRPCRNPQAPIMTFEYSLTREEAFQIAEKKPWNDAVLDFYRVNQRNLFFDPKEPEIDYWEFWKQPIE